jgi:hypothetical protein
MSAPCRYRTIVPEIRIVEQTGERAHRLRSRAPERVLLGKLALRLLKGRSGAIPPAPPSGVAPVALVSGPRCLRQSRPAAAGGSDGELNRCLDDYQRQGYERVPH